MNKSEERIALVKNGLTISKDLLELDKSVDQAKFIIYLSDKNEETSMNEDNEKTAIVEEDIE